MITVDQYKYNDYNESNFKNFLVQFDCNAILKDSREM